MVVPCLHNIGAVVHYCLVNVCLWWFFHVVALFCKVLFPVRARQWEKQKKNKYFHLAALIIGQLHVVMHYHSFLFIHMVPIGILLPLPAVVATLATEGYAIDRFPPLLCSARNSDTWYYTTTLVLNLVLMVGVCILTITFWKVHEVCKTCHRH